MSNIQLKAAAGTIVATVSNFAFLVLTMPASALVAQGLTA